MADKCNIIKYPKIWGFKREPSRPVELRKDYFNGMKFNENFDWDNLWYDAVQITNNYIFLVGPCLYNTKDHIIGNCKFTTNDGVDIKILTCIDLERTSITVLELFEPVDTVILQPSNTSIAVNKYDNTFENHKVIVTLQKDNPISWIREWIAYHKANVSINGVLIYDNASTDYTASELEKELANTGVKVKVVEWNVPYGPQGFDCDTYNTFDSDYAQHTMFEHAKRRYLTNAKLVVNADIDELLVIKNGNLDTVFDNLVVENLAGYFYKANWIEPYDLLNKKPAASIAAKNRTYKHYCCVDTSNTIDAGQKWMMIPGRGLSSQWGTHESNAPMRRNDDIYYGHYKPINTAWSRNRDDYNTNLEFLKVDYRLLANLFNY